MRSIWGRDATPNAVQLKREVKSLMPAMPCCADVLLSPWPVALSGIGSLSRWRCSFWSRGPATRKSLLFTSTPVSQKKEGACEFSLLIAPERPEALTSTTLCVREPTMASTSGSTRCHNVPLAGEVRWRCRRRQADLMEYSENEIMRSVLPLTVDSIQAACVLWGTP